MRNLQLFLKKIKRGYYLLVFLFISCVCSKYYSITGYDYKKITKYTDTKDIDVSDLSYVSVCDGVDVARLENTSIPLIITVARVWLKNKNLSIVGTEKEKFNKKGWVKAENTLSFARTSSSDLSVNANFFTYKCSFLDKFYKPLGLFVSNGKILSFPLKDFSMLIFDNKNCAKIIREGVVESDVVWGIAGYNKVIEKGKVTLEGISKKRDSRTLIGLDEGAEYLFILCVDGEFKRRSRGATLMEATNIFKDIGIFEGMELDGGGSSALVVKIDGKAHQLVPSSKRQFRRLATNIGFIVGKD